jgi:hypothetical protein
VLQVKVDLRVSAAPHMASRASAWRWAIDTLLQKSSKDRIFNLYHYDVRSHTDPQSNATLANVDLAIQNGAFVMDLDPDDADDLRLISEIFGTLEPLFDAYGWAHDEHAWTHAVSVAGGVVFCSFASPNLSFWARLPLPAAAGGRARKLPRADSGKTLDKRCTPPSAPSRCASTTHRAPGRACASCATHRAPRRASFPCLVSPSPAQQILCHL